MRLTVILQSTTKLRFSRCFYLYRNSALTICNDKRTMAQQGPPADIPAAAELGRYVHETSDRRTRWQSKCRYFPSLSRRLMTFLKNERRLNKSSELNHLWGTSKSIRLE